MTAVTVVTAVLGYPLPTAATVTLTPCMTVMSMMTVFLGYPPRKSRHRHAAILLSVAVRRRIAGHSPSLRESRGNVWHTTLQGKVCSVLHPVNAVGKIGMIFLTAGVVLHDRKGRVNLTPAFCVYGVFSRRDDSGRVS